MAAPWEHLQPLLDALGHVGGFVPTPGGYECVLERPIDVALVRALVPADDPHVHLAESSDLVWCSHCWASILGPQRLAEVQQDP